MSEKQEELFKKFGVHTIPDAEKDSEIVSHTAITEELLAEYSAVNEKLKSMELIRESLRSQILSLSKGEKGSISRGSWALILKPRKGNATIDWEGYGRDEIGEGALEEILKIKDEVKAGNAQSKYVKVGKDSLVVEVMKIHDLPDV